MNLGLILLLVLIVLLVGALPIFPHAVNWGYGPGGVIGAILIVVIILLLLGKL